MAEWLYLWFVPGLFGWNYKGGCYMLNFHNMSKKETSSELQEIICFIPASNEPSGCLQRGL